MIFEAVAVAPQSSAVPNIEATPPTTPLLVLVLILPLLLHILLLLILRLLPLMLLFLFLLLPFLRTLSAPLLLIIDKCLLKQTFLSLFKLTEVE